MRMCARLQWLHRTLAPGEQKRRDEQTEQDEQREEAEQKRQEAWRPRRPAGALLGALLVAGLLAGCAEAPANSRATVGVTSTDVAVGAAPAAAGDTHAPGTRNQRQQTRHVAAPKSGGVFQPAREAATAYLIGPHDVLDIKVPGVAELSGAMQVSDQGTIDYPLLGTLQVAGKTTRDVQHLLKKRLGAKYLQKPRVIVTVKEYKSQRFTVVGAVKKPGVYPITGSASLLQAVAMAGGLDKTSDSSNVAIFRTINGKRHGGRFDLAAIQAGRMPDPQIRRGDMVVVGQSQIKAALENIGKVLPIGNFLLLL